jgi:hypothetical protein
LGWVISYLIEMKILLQLNEGFIWTSISINKRRHEFLPAGVNLLGGYFSLGHGEALFSFKLAKNQTVFSHEQ